MRKWRQKKVKHAEKETTFFFIAIERAKRTSQDKKSST